MSSVDDHWWSGHTISTRLSLFRFYFCHWCHLFKFFIFLLFTFLSFILSSFLLFSRSDFWLPAGDTNDTFLCGGSFCQPVTDSPHLHDNNLPHSPFSSAADSAQLTINLLYHWEEEEEEREEERSREEEKEGERRRRRKREEDEKEKERREEKDNISLSLCSNSHGNYSGLPR